MRQASQRMRVSFEEIAEGDRVSAMPRVFLEVELGELARGEQRGST